jgi:hypothetical protein
MIRYNEPWKFWWDVVTLVLAIIMCFMIPVEIAFEPPFGQTTLWSFVDNFTEAIFSIDVILHFMTTVIDEDGNEVFSYQHIALDYIKEYHFWIDMASVIKMSVSFNPTILYLLPCRIPK